MRYQAFFNGFALNNFPLERVLEYIDLMQDKTVLSSLIPSSLAFLRTLSQSDSQVTHSGVRKGRETLREYFQPRKRYLEKHHAIPVLYGSLQYGNPRNLDYDMIILSDRYYEYLDAACHFDWHNEINEKWLNDREGHVTYLPVSRIKQNAELISKDANHEQLYYHSDEVSMSFSDVSIALSGMPLFPEDASSFKSLQKEYASLLRIDPVIPAFVAWDLADTVRNRRG